MRMKKLPVRNELPSYKFLADFGEMQCWEVIGLDVVCGVDRHLGIFDSKEVAEKFCELLQKEMDEETDENEDIYNYIIKEHSRYVDC